MTQDSFAGRSSKNAGYLLLLAATFLLGFLAPAPGAPDEQLPLITGLSVVRVTAGGTVELAWDIPSSAGPVPVGDLTYRVEVRRLALGDQEQPETLWAPVPGVKFSGKGAKMSALFSGVPAGVHDSARVVALSPSGEMCAQSPPVSFTIPAPRSLATGRNIALAAFVLVFITAAFLKWKEKSIRK